MITIAGPAIKDQTLRISSFPNEQDRGHKIKVKETYSNPGGSALNTAAWAAKSGLKTNFIGLIGDDDNGRYIKQQCQSFKHLDTYWHKQATTMENFILVEDDGERTLLTSGNLDAALIVEDPEKEIITNSKVNWFNGQIAQKELLPLVTKQSLTGVPLYQLAKLNKPMTTKINFAVGSSKEEQPTTDYLDDNGLEFTILTDGAAGGHYRYWGQEWQRFIAHPIQELISGIDATGAGDAFLAGLLVGLSKNKTELVSAIDLASKIGAEAVTTRGSWPSINS